MATFLDGCGFVAVRSGVVELINGNIGAVRTFATAVVFFAAPARIKTKMLAVPHRGEGSCLLAASLHLGGSALYTEKTKFRVT